MGFCNIGRLWRLSFCLLILVVFLSFLLEYVVGFPLLPALVLLLTHIFMFSRSKTVSGYESLEASIFWHIGRRPLWDFLGAPEEIEGYRAASDDTYHLFFPRSPFGMLDACPRMPTGIVREVFLPVGSDDGNGTRQLRTLQIDWDSSLYVEGESPVLLFFHPGGYIAGKPIYYVPFLSRLSRRTGARVYAIEYRLGPENPLPAGLNDCYDAYSFLISTLKIPSSKVALIGGSAGGGLVVGVLQKAVSAGLDLPASGVAISPWLDLSFEFSAGSLDENDEIDVLIPKHTLQYMRERAVKGGRDAPSSIFKDSQVSFIYGSMKAFPPLLVLASKTETIRDEAVELVRRVNAAATPHSGVVAELYVPNIDLPHVWVASCLPEGVEDSGVVSYWLLQKWEKAKIGKSDN